MTPSVLQKIAGLVLFSLIAISASATQTMTLGVPSSYGPAVVLRDRAYFVAQSPGATGELWTTDGTPAGTWSITSLAPRSVKNLIVLGDELYFVVSGKVESLWSTDGRTTPRPIMDLRGSVLEISGSGPFLFFTTINSNNTRTLWRSDGTASGTFVVAQLPGFGGVAFAQSSGRLLFFELYLGTYYNSGVELWRTDGSAAGTFKVATNLDPFKSISTFGESVFFIKDYKLWKSDGTLQGTIVFSPEYILVPPVALKGSAYFFAGSSLKRTDGTIAGTSVVKNEVGYASELFAGTDRIYYVLISDKVTIGSSDGTASGTTVLKPIPGTYSSTDDSVAGTLAYFCMQTAAGKEVWRTDGTDAGTFLVKDLSPRTDDQGVPESSNPRKFTMLQDELLFFADDGLHGFEPFSTNGTADGTQMLRNIYPETSIRGTVTDAKTGEPVRGARVTAYHDYYAGKIGTRDFPVDADGHYVIDGLGSGNYWVNAHVPDNAHLSKTWPNLECRFCDVTKGESIPATPGSSNSHVDFALTRGGSISGRVATVNGGPAAGVEVLVAASFGAPPAARAITNADGTYTTTGAIAPAESWLVYTADSAGYSGVIYPNISCATGCTATSTGTRLNVQYDDNHQGVDFVVRPRGRVRGKVLDPLTGHSFAAREATVSAYRSGQPYKPSSPEASTTVSMDGSFELALPDGRFNLLVEASHYSSTWYPDRACNVYCNQLLGTPVSAVAGQTTSGYNITTDPVGGRIAGRVLDAATGTPLANTAVRVIDGLGVVGATALTAADGSYETTPSLKPGVIYTARTLSRASFIGEVYDGGHGTPCDPCPPSFGKAISLESTKQILPGVDFALNHLGQISGVVVDAITHVPLKSVHITMKAADDSYVPVSASDATGRFLADTLLPGSYTLWAEKKGWAITAIARTTIDLDSAAQTNFVLTPSCASSGAPPPATFTANGGNGTIAIADNCTRCAFSTADWIDVPGFCPAGSIKYAITANPSAVARTGTIVLPGETIVVTQQGKPGPHRRSVR